MSPLRVEVENPVNRLIQESKNLRPEDPPGILTHYHPRGGMQTFAYGCTVDDQSSLVLEIDPDTVSSKIKSDDWERLQKEITPYKVIKPGELFIMHYRASYGRERVIHLTHYTKSSEISLNQE